MAPDTTAAVSGQLCSAAKVRPSRIAAKPATVRRTVRTWRWWRQPPPMLNTATAAAAVINTASVVGLATNPTPINDSAPAAKGIRAQ